MHHVLEILLAHDCKINSLEKLLSGWVHGNSLLVLTELGPVLLDDVFSCFSECFLFRYFLDLLTIFISYIFEDLLFVGLSLVYSHQLFNYV